MRAMGTGKGVPYAMARLGGVAITAHPRPCVTGGLKGGVREGCIQDHQEGNKEEEQNPYVAQNLMFLGYHVQYNAQGQLESHLTFKEYDEEWKLVEVSEYVLPGYAFVHDFAVTENYIIVFQVWIHAVVHCMLLLWLLFLVCVFEGLLWHMFFFWCVFLCVFLFVCFLFFLCVVGARTVVECLHMSTHVHTCTHMYTHVHTFTPIHVQPNCWVPHPTTSITHTTPNNTHTLTEPSVSGHATFPVWSSSSSK